MTERGHLSTNWFEVISVSHYGSLTRPAPWDLEERVKLHWMPCSTAQHCVFWEMKWVPWTLTWISVSWGGLHCGFSLRRQVLPWVMSWVSAGKRFAEFFYHEGVTFNHPGSRNPCWWSQLPVSAKTTAWRLVSCGPASPILHQDARIKGWKAATLPEMDHVWMWPCCP